jgi:hypothetical protein
VRLSIVGLVLGAAYLTIPLYYAGKVVAKNSFGGLFSQEFPLFVVTLPASPLGELLFKGCNYCRLVVYLLAAGLNATGLYFLGVGLEALFRWMG